MSRPTITVNGVTLNVDAVHIAWGDDRLAFNMRATPSPEVIEFTVTGSAALWIDPDTPNAGDHA